MNKRTLALTALSAVAALSLSACGPTDPTPPAVSVDAAAEGPAVTLVAPVADSSSPAATERPAVPAVPAVPPAGAPSAKAAPVPSASPSASPSGSPSGSPAKANAAAGPALRLASYDRGSGTAVLAVARPAKGAPSPSASAAAVAAVRPGQLIDSPPTAAAPHGALLAVTEVRPAGAGKVKVRTRPATISELLGDTWADIRTALDPHKIQVTPKLKDLKASYVPKPGGGGDGTASAVLQLDANDSIPLPGGAKATLDGSLELDPSVLFSYRGTHGVLAAEQAEVGFDLGAHANWHLTAALSGATGPVKFPIATLTATPTVMVGQLPVVITLNLTVYAQVSADGAVTVDTTQSYDGEWGIHADYTRGSGWTSGTGPVRTEISPLKASFSGTAAVRSSLVADGSVALCDSVGLKATVEPYLRAAVDGSVKIDSSAGKPVVEGKAGLYAGLSVNGAVMARIAILGTPLIEKDLPLKSFAQEWPLLTTS
ncbi:hypothetical protein ABT095_18415 [Kitasatospora sp. NPDC002227]|uniref:hypothetical protein n=1 Tax=Kitasatospora sp. NPDC002227 TaxID=3154773 RepID=UPI00332A048B